MNRREPQIHQYVAALAIATLLFFGGLWFGNHLSEKKLDVIDTLGRNLQLATLGSELQYELLAHEPCSAVNASSLIDELFRIGTRLDFMESELGVNDPQVLELKEYYHLLEIRHWLLMRKVQNECSLNTHFILYFYSNAGDCERCDEQGSVLTYLHRKYQDLNIYSFDIHIDNPALVTVRELYGVEEAPTLVVDGTKVESFKTSQEIEELLQ